MGIVIPAALVLAVIGAALVTYLARAAARSPRAEDREEIELKIRQQLDRH